MTTLLEGSCEASVEAFLPLAPAMQVLGHESYAWIMFV
jgi:hypothetical protein